MVGGGKGGNVCAMVCPQQFRLPPTFFFLLAQKGKGANRGNTYPQPTCSSSPPLLGTVTRESHALSKGPRRSRRR